MISHEDNLARVIKVSLSIFNYLLENNRSAQILIASCTGTLVYKDLMSKLTKHSSLLGL